MAKRRKQSDRKKNQTDTSLAPGCDQNEPLAPMDGLSRMLRAAGTALLGLLLVWCFLQPLDATSVFIGEASPQDLGWLICAAILSISLALSSQSVSINPAKIVVALAATAWLAVGAYLAGHDNNPRVAWQGFWHVVALGAAYYSMLIVVTDTRVKAYIVTLTLIGSLAVAIHGVHQATIGFERDREAYLQDPDGMLAELGIEAPVGSPERARYESRLLGSSEPYATFALANSLATVMVAAMIMFIGISFEAYRSWKFSSAASENEAHRKRQLRALVICVIAVAVLTGVLLLTRSRSSFVAALIGLVGLLLYQIVDHRRIPKTSLWWAAGSTSLIVAFGLIWLARFDPLVISQTSYSLRFRLEYWYATLQLLSEHWLTGIGFGNFQKYYPIQMLESASETIADPHNWFLDIAISLSLPIACLVTWWITTKFLTGMRPTKKEAEKSPTSTESHLASAFLAGACIGGTACFALVSLLNGLDKEAVFVSWITACLLGLGGIYPAVHQMVAKQSTVLLAACVTMAVCLLATGSWQATGIVIPFLCWIASSESTRLDRQPKSATSIWTAGFLVLMLVVFLIQHWSPTVKSWTLIQQASTSNNAAAQLELLQQASNADSLDVLPLRYRADILNAAAVNASPVQFAASAERANRARLELLAKDSVGFLNWQIAGDGALTLASAAKSKGQDEQKWLAAAEEYYTQASSRYPSNARLQLQTGLVAGLISHTQKSHQRLAEALRLSEQTPHDDKKLETQLFFLPIGLAPAALADQFPSESTKTLHAEPIVQWLRSK